MIPKVLRIEPASSCNLSCSHCPTGTVKMTRGIMSNTVFQRILQELKKNLNSIKVIVLYHGGEPLLNKNFFENALVIRKLSEKLYIRTVSNGMVLNNNNNKLINCGLDEILISLDGSSQLENDEVRVKSNSSKIIGNIQNLISLKKKYNSNLKISIVTTQFLRSKNEVNDRTKHLQKVPEWIKKSFGEEVSYESHVAMKWPDMNVGDQYEEVLATGEDKNYCDHVINTMTIRHNGDVVPCCYDLTTKLKMGNIMDDSISNIFNGTDYLNLRKSITNKDYFSICANCNTVRLNMYLIKKNQKNLF